MITIAKLHGSGVIVVSNVEIQIPSVFTDQHFFFLGQTDNNSQSNDLIKEIFLYNTVLKVIRDFVTLIPLAE
jgi:hypothetical protein